MTEQEIIDGNKVIAEFIGWYIDISTSYDYPSQEWHYTKNRNGGWSSGKCVHLTSSDIDKKRSDVDNELWQSLLNPSYGRAGNYHLNWNKLMPVVEKIESLHDEHHGYFAVHISSNTCSIQGTNLWKAIEDLEGYGHVYMSDPNAVFGTKIESTWYNVVQFIKWYTENYPT